MRKSGMKVHSWINYPNKATKQCTRCGAIYRIRTKNGKNIVTYEINNIESESYFQCKE